MADLGSLLKDLGESDTIEAPDDLGSLLSDLASTEETGGLPFADEFTPVEYQEDAGPLAGGMYRVERGDELPSLKSAAQGVSRGAARGVLAAAEGILRAPEAIVSAGSTQNQQSQAGRHIGSEWADAIKALRESPDLAPDPKSIIQGTGIDSVMQALTTPEWWFNRFPETAVNSIINLLPGLGASKAARMAGMAGPAAQKLGISVASATVGAQEIGSSYDDLYHDLVEKGVKDADAKVIAGRGAVAYGVTSALIERGILPHQWASGSLIRRAIFGGVGEMTEEEAQMLTQGLMRYVAGEVAGVDIETDITPMAAAEAALAFGPGAALSVVAGQERAESVPQETLPPTTEPQELPVVQADMAEDVEIQETPDAVQVGQTGTVHAPVQEQQEQSTEEVPEQVGAQEVPGPRVEQEAVETPDVLPRETAPRNAAIEKDLEALHRELPTRTSKSFRQSLDEAVEQGIPDRALRIATEINAKPRTMSDAEQAGLTHRQVSLKNEYESLAKKLESETDDSAIASTGAEMNRVADEFVSINTALVKGGSEIGRALSIRRMTLDRDYSLIAVKARAMAAKGKKLTPAQEGMFNELAAKLSKAEADLSALQQSVSEQEATRAIRRRGVKAKAETPANTEAMYAKARELLAAGC